ncbi:MAG TPA: aminotransferase class V-fold PLP-dependent enzyme [Solirubrobacteraceae bacterium]|jgi:glutamate/tyrosine decarboxylase-like PLP-dependent enzyme|nr:aminotransferase class V-fold PLP-dependent enzyme [Solirubrobacteraceae bacterium]
MLTTETAGDSDHAAARALLEHTAARASDYLAGMGSRRVGPAAAPADVLAGLDAPLPAQGVDPMTVIEDLRAATAPGLAATGAARYFGFVIGGTLPVALAADWLTSTWDQLTGLAAVAPATSAVEQVAGRWLLDVLGLPDDASFAFVTGTQMAHVTSLAAARHRVLADAGWSVERDGLNGAPRVRILATAERHISVDRAVRLLGLGEQRIEEVAVDERGAMRADALAAALRGGEPTIVCAQAGNVDSGSIDPLGEIADAVEQHGAWLHVDGAFGLWAAASRARRHLVDGIARAHSWSTDAHKWLNVPYDCGVAFVKDREAHRAALALTAPYLIHGDPNAVTRDPVDWTPEFSRRARAVPVYAALRSLGREGVEELVDRLCDCAERFAERFAGEPDVDVVARGLNQVLVRFGGDDSVTEDVIRRVQDDGTMWAGGTTWKGMRCMRLSVCSWQTTLADVDRSADVILGALRNGSQGP